MVVTRVDNTTTFVAEPHNSTLPAEGYDYVRLGNFIDTNRQGSVYMTADDDDAPFIDVVDGIKYHNDWNLSVDSGSGVKARLGKLTGINSTTWGNLDGYGLYSDRVYLEGGIKATSGQIGGWGITSTSITSSNITLDASTQ